jgi:uncharacterized protein with PIN domain
MIVVDTSALMAIILDDAGDDFLKTDIEGVL